jgi:osmotically-inducible protein OsmY
MKLDRLAAGFCAALFLAGVAGCNTQKDVNAADRAADRAGRTAENTTDQAGAGIKDAAKDATAALVVTPLVKNAITADKTLNDGKNKIDVDSKDNVVHLRGHVQTNAMKKRAGEVAKKALDENNSTDKLSNELTVKQH